MDLLLALTTQMRECIYLRPGTRFTTSAAPVYLRVYRVEGVSGDAVDAAPAMEGRRALLPDPAAPPTVTAPYDGPVREDAVRAR